MVLGSSPGGRTSLAVVEALGRLQGCGTAQMIDRAQLVRDLTGRIEAFSGDPLRKATMPMSEGGGKDDTRLNYHL